MKVQIKSIFEQISEQVFVMTNVNEAKAFITDFVNNKDINEHDKIQILNNIQPIKNIIKLQTYICNSLLKYEGMGVSINKPEKAV
jgi:hypothetical protein